MQWDKSPLPQVGDIVENRGLRKHLSLTGIYHLVSNYGESISRPAGLGGIILFIATLFNLPQNDGQWLNSFQRSLADFVPFLPFAGTGDEVGIGNYIIKIGGGLIFGLFAIALRRKFERKYTR